MNRIREATYGYAVLIEFDKSALQLYSRLLETFILIVQRAKYINLCVATV